MQWFRVYNEILDDPKIARMDGETFRSFIYLLAVASEQEKEGEIDMTLDDISWRIRIQKDALETSISYMQENEIISVMDGKIFISNWKKRQFASDNVGERVKRHREKQCNVTRNVESNVIEQNRTEQNRTDKHLTTKNVVAYSEAFLKFWRSYPKKVGKDAAWKAWKKRNGNIPDIATIISAIEEQKRSDQWEKESGQYIPNPATWLNQGRWNDETSVSIEKDKGSW